MKKYASYACILAAAACWGCIGLFNRPMLNAGIAPENLVVIRNLGGLAVLALFFLCTDRSVFKMKAKHLPIFIATGIISVVLFTLCYFNAQKLCSLSVSAILLYTAPAMVVLMSALVFKEKITGKKLLALALALLGCALVTGVFTGGLSLTTKGLLFGLGAAFSTRSIRFSRPSACGTTARSPSCSGRSCSPRSARCSSPTGATL